ncbi:hypothetical protein ZHAS_00016745 [Anopheles sinensis]|uniref:Uncharacterized protein n=1 Tax=Anopheles sinensis TaxID=74873 RepID=A0A084WEU6_ANOSI|nr:hypothetical protein ZHAS_00016745 [Anopheles sinensis]
MSITERIRQSYWFENISRKTIVATLVASLLVGWWIIIDTASVYPSAFNFSYYICGILATISFVMLHGSAGFTGGILGESGIKVFLFAGFVLGFTAIIAAIWIMIADFAVNESRTDKYPGYALLMHNVFIFFSMIIYKFGRHSESDYLGGY